MAFDLLLSRGAHLPSFTGPPLPPPAKPRGFFARLFTKPPPVNVCPEQISYDAFHLIMSGAPAERRNETTYYVRHRQGGDAWFAAELLPEGYIKLSASHAYHAFPRNFGDMLDMGLRLTALVRAQLYTVDGTEIVSADIGRLLAPDGPFLKTQIAAFQSARARIERDGMAPYEYPRDGVDLVPDYFTFSVAAPLRPLADIEQALAANHRKIVDRSNGLLIGDREGTPLTRVRHDGAWRVTSTWAAPFDIDAHFTLDVADELAKHLGAPLVYAGREEVHSRRMPQLRTAASGLGMDFVPKLATWISR